MRVIGDVSAQEAVESKAAGEGLVERVLGQRPHSAQAQGPHGSAAGCAPGRGAMSASPQPLRQQPPQRPSAPLPTEAYASGGGGATSASAPQPPHPPQQPPAPSAPALAPLLPTGAHAGGGGGAGAWQAGEMAVLDQVREELRLTEMQLVFGRTQRERSAALDLATTLREELAVLRRLQRMEQHMYAVARVRARAPDANARVPAPAAHTADAAPAARAARRDHSAPDANARVPAPAARVDALAAGRDRPREPAGGEGGQEEGGSGGGGVRAAATAATGGSTRHRGDRGAVTGTEMVLTVETFDPRDGVKHVMGSREAMVPGCPGLVIVARSRARRAARLAAELAAPSAQRRTLKAATAFGVSAQSVQNGGARHGAEAACGAAQGVQHDGGAVAGGQQQQQAVTSGQQQQQHRQAAHRQGKSSTHAPPTAWSQQHVWALNSDGLRVWPGAHPDRPDTSRQVDTVAWRPAPAHTHPVHPPRWKAAGDWAPFDAMAELARAHGGMPVDDWRGARASDAAWRRDAASLRCEAAAVAMDARGRGTDGS
ncbi:hypothetical protein FOA52_009709 [Chlamydomonas sp. UWO 241]|nr:hypothetical protein FOA52_009709 [Chlamydomonas sp. UWO 241]